MRIRDIFATEIQQRIEPVVKVADRRPGILLGELQNLVITPQWERYLWRLLDHYTDAADREDEQGIGIWISGFFGSGKSLLMKTLGVLLQGGVLDGKSVHETFLSRVPLTSAERADLQRFLTICQRKLATTSVGGNIHALQASRDDTLSLIAFKLFADERGYTHNWPLAWAVEHQIDARGLSDAFHRRASELAGAPWEEVADDPEFYLDQLYEAAADVLPEHFKGGASGVDKAAAAVRESGITPAMLVDRLRHWCERRDADGRRHKLLLQLDEVGQWIASGNVNERIMQVQALVERAAEFGAGRIWVAVTAHGDIQALSQNVTQEQFAKITQRFASPCKLSNDDINQVVEERLLRKTQPARGELERLYADRSGALTDLGTLQNPSRVYPVPQQDSFALFYPYLPWTVTVIPDVVKGIAQAAHRGEELTGATRTMIGVVQGAILETNGFLDQPVGGLLSLADLYGQLQTDVTIEAKTDLNRIQESVPDATSFTVRTARALFLLGQAQYIPTTVENVSRALVDALEVDIVGLRQRTVRELDRLVRAGYAKKVGDQYVFLSTQQRTFQDRVRARQDELLGRTYDLIQALKEYDSDDALRFDRVSIAEGRDIALRLEIDDRVVRNKDSHVAVRVYSPLQRTLDPKIDDDAELRQRSTFDSDNIIFRLDEVSGLRATLALAVATAETADKILGAGQISESERDVARHAKQIDLAEHKGEVRRLLGQAVRGGTVFFRGSSYPLAAGDSPSEAVRATLRQLLPNIYARFLEMPYRVINEESAVKAALKGDTTNPDLRNLGAYRADGTFNDSNPWLSTLRGRLPLVDQAQAAIGADQLRSDFEHPPFGWDGNAVKIGLALLLRASACRVLENNQPYTDPNAPEVAALLTKEARFKNVRVQGVKTDVDMKDLQRIRDYMDQIYAVRPSVIPATLSNVLGEKLAATESDAKAVEAWATTAQCPLPTSFMSGLEVVRELLQTAAAPVRLRLFLEQAERVAAFEALVARLKAFRAQHSATYLEMRDFFNVMVNAETGLPAVTQFINDWRALLQERSFTTAERWNELAPVYHAARQALNGQIETWRAQTRRELEGIEAGLAERLRAAGVPDAEADDAARPLTQALQVVRDEMAWPNPSYIEAKRWAADLSSAKLAIGLKVQELQAHYKPHVKDNGPARLAWRDVLQRVEIDSPERLDTLLDGLRKRLKAELDQHERIIIE